MLLRVDAELSSMAANGAASGRMNQYAGGPKA
jgi:hypothetical protein